MDKVYSGFRIIYNIQDEVVNVQFLLTVVVIVNSQVKKILNQGMLF